MAKIILTYNPTLQSLSIEVEATSEDEKLLSPIEAMQLLDTAKVGFMQQMQPKINQVPFRGSGIIPSRG